MDYPSTEASRGSARAAQAGLAWRVIILSPIAAGHPIGRVTDLGSHFRVVVGMRRPQRHALALDAQVACRSLIKEGLARVVGQMGSNDAKCQHAKDRREHEP